MTAYANVTQISTGLPLRGAGAVQAAVPSRTAGKLRLTRRGRIVLGALAALLVAGMLAVVATLAAPGAVASTESGVQEFPYVLAQPGDSLWSIAQDLDPGADTRDVIAEIVRLNQLASSGLQVGEAIAVPMRFASTDRALTASEAGL